MNPATEQQAKSRNLILPSLAKTTPKFRSIQIKSIYKLGIQTTNKGHLGGITPTWLQSKVYFERFQALCML